MVPAPLWFDSTGWRYRLGGQQAQLAMSVVMGLGGTVFCVAMWLRATCPGAFRRFYFLSLAFVSTTRKGHFRILAPDFHQSRSVAGARWFM